MKTQVYFPKSSSESSCTALPFANLCTIWLNSWQLDTHPCFSVSLLWPHRSCGLCICTCERTRGRQMTAQIVTEVTLPSQPLDHPLRAPAVNNRRRQWHPTPELLPGKSHGQRVLVGYSSWGCKESDTTERLHFHSQVRNLAFLGTLYQSTL